MSLFNNLKEFLGFEKSQKDDIINKTSNREYGKWLLEKPLIGYKKIECKCKENKDIWGDFVATVEVPEKTYVIAPKYNSKELRTSEYKIKDIEKEGKKRHYEMSNVPDKLTRDESIPCRSKWDLDFKYDVGKTYKSHRFDKYEQDTIEPGLYFYLNFRDAYNY
jgi:hypothetical protein